MRRLATLAATLLLTLCAANADASVVNFQGVIDFGGGGSAVLGAPTPNTPRNFTLSINFTDGSGLTLNEATVDGGSFDVQSPLTNFTVAGGTIIVGEGAPSDAATFIVDVTGPASGQLIFTFAANAIVDDDANQANIDALVANNVANFTADFSASSAGVYTGQITAVPEPSSCLALLGFVGGAWKWRRNRRQQAAV